jgi:hypothetical protein
VLFAVYPLLRKRSAGEPETELDLLVSGFFAALAVTFELPAAAFAAGVAVPFLVARPVRTLVWFVPPFVLVLAAYFAANIAAIGTWKPAYSDFGGAWYEFPGSHWLKLKDPVRPRGIDFADEPGYVYLFHMLLGHHGWFSLTPVWLLGLGGLVGAAVRAWPDVKRLFARPVVGPIWSLRLVLAMTLAVSVVVFAFFTYRTNNYGGFTSGLRWVFWLTPCWPCSRPRIGSGGPGPAGWWQSSCLDSRCCRCSTRRGTRGGRRGCCNSPNCRAGSGTSRTRFDPAAPDRVGS